MRVSAASRAGWVAVSCTLATGVGVATLGVFAAGSRFTVELPNLEMHAG